MFNECHKLKEIKGIDNFNTSNVIDMKLMFHGCYELEYLDLILVMLLIWKLCLIIVIN